jgi:hypothetical protein
VRTISDQDRDYYLYYVNVFETDINQKFCGLVDMYNRKKKKQKRFTTDRYG